MPRIMILDDRKDTRDSYARALQLRASQEPGVPQGPVWEVSTAPTRPAALKSIREAYAAGRPIDILLTDLRVRANDDGIKVLTEARAVDPGLMAILYTTQPRGFDRELAYKLNAVAIVHTLDPDISAVEEFYYLIRRALELKTQQQLLGALRRHVSRPVCEALARNPNGLPLRRQRLTVCFWDIRGFSTLTGQIYRLDVLSDFIREYFKLAEDVISEHNGLLDKFIGDGVMALFGYSLAGQPEEGTGYGAATAVAAAVEFERRFNALAGEWLPRFDLASRPRIVRPTLGCGMNTGEDIVVGYVGGETRGEFTALGLDVNLAARVQDMARDGKSIILTKATYLAFAGTGGTQRYQVTSIGDHAIRSHESLGPIPLYWLRD